MQRVAVALLCLFLVSCNQPSFLDKSHSGQKDASPALPVKPIQPDADGFIALSLKKELKDSSGRSVDEVEVSGRVPFNEPFVEMDGRLISPSQMERDQEVGLVGFGASRFDDSAGADVQGVIVELKGESVAKVVARGQARGLSQERLKEAGLERARQVASEQAALMQKLESALGRQLVGVDSTPSKASIRSRSFQKALNAVALLDVDLKTAETQLRGLKEVKAIYPNVKVKVSLHESSKIVRADEVWTKSVNGTPLDGTGIEIGIIDTGVNYSHPDLGGCLGSGCKVVGGYDFYNNDNDPIDDHGHGTHVAATAAGAGSYIDGSGATQSLLGMAPGASIHAIKVLSSSGSGSSASVIAGIEYCADPNGDGDFSDHLDVCNLSLGGPGNPDDSLSQAVDNITDIGVVFAVAAGNTGPKEDTVASPGAARKAVTVGASCKPGDASSYCSGGPIASFSSRGPVRWVDADGVEQTLMKPDIAAPGVDICAAQHPGYQTSRQCLDGSHIAISGTSMATPHVAGLAALLIQAQPALAPAEVKQALMGGAVDLGAVQTAQGAGQVDIYRSLELVGMPSSWLVVSGGPLVFYDEPTQKLQTFTKTITLTNDSGGHLNLTAAFSGDPGLSGQLNQTSISLAQGESTSLTITLSVDHSIAPSSSQLQGAIQLSGGPEPYQLLTRVNVAERLASDVKLVDFGAVSPDTSGSSVSQSVQLKNLISDLDASYSLSFVCCGSGTDAEAFQASIDKSQLALAGGGSDTVTLTVTVDPNLLQKRGTFTGKFVAESSLSRLEVPATIFVGYALEVDFGTETERPWVTRIYSATQSWGFGKSMWDPALQKQTIYVTSPPPYIYISLFNTTESPTIIGEDVYADADGVARIPIQQSMASHRITYDFTHSDGSALSDGLQSQGFFQRRSSYPRQLLSFYSSGRMSTGWVQAFSGFSSNIIFAGSAFAGTSDPVTEIDLYNYYLQNGLSGDVVMSNSSSSGDARNFIVPDKGHIESPLAEFRLYSGTTHVGTSKYLATLNPGQTNRINGYLWTDLAAGESFYHKQLMGNRINLYESVNGSKGTRITKTPVFWLSADESMSSKVNDMPILMSQPHYGWPLQANPGTDSFGLDRGPGFDPKHFNGYQLGECWVRHHGSYHSETYKELTDIEENMNVSVLLDGALVNSGSVVGSDICGFQFFKETADGSYVHGLYEITLAKKRQVAGVLTDISATHAIVVNGLRTDKRPPKLEALFALSGGSSAEEVDNSLASSIQFVLNPYRHYEPNDSLQSLSAEVSTDGGATWKSMNLSTLAENFYKADIPTEAGVTLYTFKIYGQDLAGNALTYQFQMPAKDGSSDGGGGQDPDPDTTKPTAQITSPSNGETLSGTVTVSGSATDDVGVVRVDLILDGQVVHSANASSLSYALDTTQLTNAGHTLYMAAYDAAGNVGTSSLITVTVSNEVPDTSQPVAKLTSPSDGATVSGTISVTGSATDDVGVVKTELYFDSQLVHSESSGSLSYSLDTTTVANGDHSLQLKAYDAAGNVGASTLITISVNNEVPDTTKPTAQVTSPSNGETLSGTVTVSGSATDDVGVVRVDLILDGQVVHSANASSLSYALDTTQLTNAGHTLYMAAYDAAGNTGTSSLITVTVSNSTNTAPTAPVLSSATETKVKGQMGVELVWLAAKDDKAVAGYRIYRDGTLLTSVSANELSFFDSSVGVSGTVSYFVKAFDAEGLSSEASNSQTVTLTGSNGKGGGNDSGGKPDKGNNGKGPNK